MITKNRKEEVDKLIEEIKKSGGYMILNGEFSFRLDYIDDCKIRECWRGFFITINPIGRDGTGITVEFDPYDEKICSGVTEIVEENKGLESLI